MYETEFSHIKDLCAHFPISKEDTELLVVGANEIRRVLNMLHWYCASLLNPDSSEKDFDQLENRFTKSLKNLTQSLQDILHVIRAYINVPKEAAHRKGQFKSLYQVFLKALKEVESLREEEENKANPMLVAKTQLQSSKTNK